MHLLYLEPQHLKERDMSNRDVKSTSGLAVLHSKVATTATQSIQGTVITGWDGASFIIDVGAHTADDLVITYQEKDTSGSWTNIAEADLKGNDATQQSRSIVAADANTQIWVGYTGRKDNIGVVITDSGTGSAVLGAYVVKGFPTQFPKNA